MRSLRFLYKRAVLFALNLFSLTPSCKCIMPIKQNLLKMIGCRVGVNCEISEYFYVHDGRFLMINDGARIGAFARIWDFSQITIGKNLLCSHGLTMISGTHSVNNFEAIEGPIIIGDNVWIGANVTIVGPVKIGDNAVIGACSFVKADIPPKTVWGGVPARMLALKTD